MSLFIKIISLYNHIHFLAILYPTSLANLVVEVGTKHCHQILLGRDNYKKIRETFKCWDFVAYTGGLMTFWKILTFLQWDCTEVCVYIYSLVVLHLGFIIGCDIAQHY